MNNLGSLGKILISIGIFFLFTGFLFLLFKRVPFFGKLPGDIYIHKKQFTFFFPLTSSILISLILTIILNLFFRK
ncbi:DUF2905 domain-containing protein [candidate division WOR-3 bacterium]|nr:DUF2905 domain-containing protein [candidate division WOR-3 bacterium]